MSEVFKKENVYIGDYVKIEFDGWLRVTEVTEDGFYSVNSALSEMIHLPFSDIQDLNLESEMPYGENF